MVFGVAESEFDIRIVKFNMADSKWPTQNSCQMLKYYRDLEKLYIEVFEVAESENLALEFLISIWPTLAVEFMDEEFRYKIIQNCFVKNEKSKKLTP